LSRKAIGYRLGAPTGPLVTMVTMAKYLARQLLL
jgi:hypothetical protein